MILGSKSFLRKARAFSILSEDHRLGRLAVEREDAAGDAAGVVEKSLGEERAHGIIDGKQVAVDKFGGALDRSGEHPRVSPLERLLFAGL